jgi:hypothetical protein
MAELESGVAQGAYGGQPYGDMTEVTGLPETNIITAPYREFLATDARSVCIVMFPNHYNFIPNPSFRVDTAGWDILVGIDSQNLLTDNQASIETDLTGITAGANCSIARSTAQAYHGTASLEMTCTTGGYITANVGGFATDGLPVKGDTYYTGSIRFRAATVGRQSRVQLNWYNSSGTIIGGGTLGPDSLSSTTDWVEARYTMKSAPNAAYVAFAANILGAVAGEVHYVDAMGFWEGQGGAWTMPGIPIEADVSMDPDDTWVGKAIAFNDGSATAAIRYRGLDSDGNPAYIYVGPDKPPMEQLWYESGRHSPEWTFSYHVKGRARVRTTISAYYPQDVGVVGSPPRFPVDMAPTQGDPDDWPYGTDPVLDSEGKVWTPKGAPFYNRLSKPAVSLVPPSTITSEAVIPSAVRDPADDVWEVAVPYPVTEVPPLYVLWGTPIEVSNPAVEDPADHSPNKYLQDPVGNLWMLKEPLPPPPLDELGQPVSTPPPYYYYLPIILTVLDDPATYRPDTSLFAKYLLYDSGTMDLWVLKDPIPSVAPYYELLATPSVHIDIETDPSDDPDRIPPDEGKPYLLVENVDNISKDGWVWALDSTGYYEPTGQSPWFARVRSAWLQVDRLDWGRITLQTAARMMAEGSPSASVSEDEQISFLGAYWIDALIEVEEAGEGFRIASLMLDPNEHPVAEYFDGDMAEDPRVDDYIWEGAPNESVSNYYYDRRIRTRWLWENLKWVVPVGRPYQLFYRVMSEAYVPPDATQQSLSPSDGLIL